MRCNLDQTDPVPTRADWQEKEEEEGLGWAFAL